ncbi:MAG: tetratricopeptide repeat protein [Gemmatimonadaceae bacterium]
MRGFDWLRGRTREKNGEPVRPKVLSGDDQYSPFIVVEVEGTTVVMDRDAYDYAYGDSKAPDPAQRDLDQILPRIDRVVAKVAGIFRGQAMGSEVVIDTSDAEALAGFRQTLRIVEDPATFHHCGCLGGPTLELYDRYDLVATIGLQHGHSIRWSRWKHDARLEDGELLSDWLTRYGLEPALLHVLFHNQYGAGGLSPVGFQRSGPVPLSRAEQRVRLAELRRAQGGDPRQALMDCQRELDQEPEMALGYAVRGKIRHQLQDYAGCVADCSEAMRLGLHEPEMLYTRAVAYDHLQRPLDAIADCTAALEIDPKLASALNSRGAIRGRLGQLDEALRDLNEAMRLAPKWELPYLNRAQVHAQRADWDAAVADCDRVIEALQESGAANDRAVAGTAFWQRAQYHLQQGEDLRAAADFAEAVRRRPDLAERRR